MKQAILVILLMCSASLTHSATLTSCESTLLNSATSDRGDFSDICYTQFIKGDPVVSQVYDFLKWTAHWDAADTKTLTQVDNWQAAMEVTPVAITGQSGWRLPTIKELVKISNFSNVNASDISSAVLNKYWMLQQWFSQDPAINAYIASSTYQGGQPEPTVKVMALNISTGKVEAIARDFSGKTVYVVKVKNEEPSWQVHLNHYYVNANNDNRCLAWWETVDSGVEVMRLKTLVCNTQDTSTLVDTAKWFYEEATGFFRAFNGKCLKVSGYTNADPLELDECRDYNTVGKEHAARWTKVSLADGLTFQNIKGITNDTDTTTRYYMYATSGDTREVRIENYSPYYYERQQAWTLVPVPVAAP